MQFEDFKIPEDKLLELVNLRLFDMEDLAILFSVGVLQKQINIEVFEYICGPYIADTIYDFTKRFEDIYIW